MTRPIEKQLRALVDQWGAMLDARTETFDLIIPNEIEAAIDSLIAEVRQESLVASNRAKKVAQKLIEGGKPIGRTKIKTPPASELRKMLARMSLQAMSKELKVSRATIRQRMAEGEYVGD